MTGLLLLGCLFSLILAQFKERFRKYRIYAIFIFLTVSLGPGLLVNGVLKPNWGRPRPRVVTELGGLQEYREFYKPAMGLPGQSFPCGHCSVGFSYALFWLIFRRRNKWVATSFLLSAIIIGSLMGIGRMADGGHFLSDVVWAALISWFTSFILYYFVLNIPAIEDQTQLPRTKIKKIVKTIEDKKALLYSIYLFLGMGTLTVALLATPFSKNLNYTGNNSSIKGLEINIDNAVVEFSTDSELKENFIIIGSAKGFGFPTNHIEFNCDIQTQLSKCSITKHGFYSDFESGVKIIVNPKLVNDLNLLVKKGDLLISKANPIPFNYKLLIKTK
jgi:membrane-associated phospholipid phosphatase